MVDFNEDYGGGKTYDVQIMVGGKLTSTILKHVNRRDLALVNAVEHGRDDIDLRGVWAGLEEVSCEADALTSLPVRQAR